MTTDPILKNATDEHWKRYAAGTPANCSRLGLSLCCPFASEMGYSPYIKLGFKDTGQRVSRYLWRNV